MIPGVVHDFRVIAKTSLETDRKPVSSELEAQNEAQELALSYARDIVNSWPNMTLRTMSQMTNKINALREALELAKR